MNDDIKPGQAASAQPTNGFTPPAEMPPAPGPGKTPEESVLDGLDEVAKASLAVALAGFVKDLKAAPPKIRAAGRKAILQAFEKVEASGEKEVELGDLVFDEVTAFRGVVAAMVLQDTGNVRALIQSQKDDGTMGEAAYIDVPNLTVEVKGLIKATPPVEEDLLFPLGSKIQDVETGHVGRIRERHVDLSGCVSYASVPKLDKKLDGLHPLNRAHRVYAQNVKFLKGPKSRPDNDFEMLREMSEYLAAPHVNATGDNVGPAATRVTQGQVRCYTVD